MSTVLIRPPPLPSTHDLRISTSRRKKRIGGGHSTLLEQFKMLAEDKNINSIDDAFCEIAAILGPNGFMLEPSVIEDFLIKWIEDIEDDQGDALMEHILEQLLTIPSLGKGKKKAHTRSTIRRGRSPHLLASASSRSHSKGKGKSVSRLTRNSTQKFDVEQSLSILEEHEKAVQLLAEAQRPTYECGVCFDTFQLAEDVAGVVGVGSSSDGSAAVRLGTLLPCTHGFCAGCLSEFLSHKLKEQSLTFPISCPGFKCTGIVSDTVAERVLGKEGMDAWWQKVVESGLQDVVYCPHKGCGAPMELDPDVKKQVGPVECWECHRGFCGNCLTTWHTGLTCKQYQTLPPSQRNPEEVALLNLATSMSWHRCPKCRALIERNQGCNHMTCRCKAEFCYRCGNNWVNSMCSVNCHNWNDAQLKEERMRLGIKYFGEDAEEAEKAEKKEKKGKMAEVKITPRSSSAAGSSTARPPTRPSTPRPTRPPTPRPSATRSSVTRSFTAAGPSTVIATTATTTRSSPSATRARVGKTAVRRPVVASSRAQQVPGPTIIGVGRNTPRAAEAGRGRGRGKDKDCVVS